MLLTVEVLANEIKIIAKVNQTPITNFDLSQRIEMLAVIMPNFQKYNDQEKQQIALQNLVQDALKQEYIAKTNFVISASDERKNRADMMKMIKMQDVGNVQEFMMKHNEFFTLQAVWQGVMEKNFLPNINVTDEMVESIKKKTVKLTDLQIREILIQKQLESYGEQAIESVRKVSIVEIIG
jgi:hypothetical protein